METAVQVIELEPTNGALNPFQRADMADHVNAGVVEIESQRAVAEAQGKMVIAKRFPRDPFKAMQAILDACKRPSLAETSMYEYRRGGQAVRGPSIRLAEEIARCWGNVDYGLRELSSRDGVSELEAYAWDMETNTYSAQRFTVRHIRDTREGTYDLRDQRDIYENNANLGARRMRARILAIIPDDVVEAAVAQCAQTLRSGGDKPMSDRIKEMVARFGELGVSAAHLEERLGHPLAETLPDELVEMHSIYQSLRDEQSKRTDWFGGGARSQPETPDSYPQEHFEKNLPKWTELIESGARSADDIINVVQSKAPLSDDQVTTLRAIQPKEAE